MANPWDPEHVVDLALAGRLLAEHLPALASLPLRPFAEGWDNTAYLAGGVPEGAPAWVIRFPRRQVAIPLLEREVYLLPWLGPQLPVAIPAPLGLAPPSDAFPAPFAAYPHLQGETGCGVDPETAPWADLAASLGAFLKALHGVDAREAEARGAPHDEISRLDIDRRLSGICAMLRGLEAGPAGDLARRAVLALEEVAARAPRRAPPEDEGVLCHGDLYGRHLLLDPAGHLCGVIDWGDLHVGERAIDLMIVEAFLPPAHRPGFEASYGPIGPGTRARARFRALNSLSHVLAYGLGKGDLGMLRLGWRGLDWACGGDGDPEGLGEALAWLERAGEI